MNEKISTDEFHLNIKKFSSVYAHVKALFNNKISTKLFLEFWEITSKMFHLKLKIHQLLKSCISVCFCLWKQCTCYGPNVSFYQTCKKHIPQEWRHANLKVNYFNSFLKSFFTFSLLATGAAIFYLKVIPRIGFIYRNMLHESAVVIFSKCQFLAPTNVVDSDVHMRKRN